MMRSAQHLDVGTGGKLDQGLIEQSGYVNGRMPLPNVIGILTEIELSWIASNG